MKTTDTSERGLESLIMQSLEADGYTIGSNRDYDRALCNPRQSCFSNF